MPEISPDLQRALLLMGLLIGPTCLWLLYRVLRGPDSTRLEKFDLTGSLFDTAELKMLIAGDGEWPCEICRSLNQPGADRCYKCRALRSAAQDPLTTPIDAEPPIAPEPAAPVRPARRTSTPVAVPVTAGIATAGVAQPSGRMRPMVTAMNAGDVSDMSVAVPAAASIRRLPLPELPTGRGVPVMDQTVGPGVPVMKEIVGTRRLAERSADWADHGTAALPPTPVGCPLLGLKDDPRSRFEFPHPAHRCGATAVPGIISLNDQKAFCCGAYDECARFRTHAGASGSLLPGSSRA